MLFINFDENGSCDQKRSLFFSASGVILSFWPYTSKLSLTFSMRKYLLGAQTFSFLCIFIFYVVKFCAMMPKIFYLVSQQFMVESQSHIFFFSFMLTFTTPPSIHYTTIGLKHILGKIKRGWGCNTRLLVLLYLALLYLAVTYTRLSFGIIQPQKIWKVIVQNTIKN